MDQRFTTQIRLLSGLSLPKSVKIVEVGPRDGLQNEKVSLVASCPAVSGCGLNLEIKYTATV